MAGLVGATDDDEQDADTTDGAGAHKHGAATVAVDEVDAQEGANCHDGGLEGVHQQLLLVGDDAGRLGHERHVVAGWR